MYLLPIGWLCKTFEHMFTQKHYPTTIAPETLDKYLATGWHPMGQAMYTCKFSFFNGRLYSAIWTRTCLRDYRFSKRNRKLMRRNASRFRIEYRPFVLEQAHEKLFERYAQHFDGRLSRTLAAYLLDERDRNIFDSMEARVYDGKRFVAFSCFHVGKCSLASIIGVYDPDYRRYSLGYYTLLLEIAYGLERDFSFFYPGYVIPGNPRFDYKLRAGHIQFFDFWKQVWRPWEDFSAQYDPLQVTLKRLDHLGALLAAQNIGSRLLYNPFFEGNLFGLHSNSYLEQPIVLELWPGVHPHKKLLAYYDERYSSWVLAYCLLEKDYFLSYCIMQDMGLDVKDEQMLNGLLQKVVYRFATRPEQLVMQARAFKDKLRQVHERD